MHIYKIEVFLESNVLTSPRSESLVRLTITITPCSQTICRREDRINVDGLTTQVDTFMTSHVRGGYKKEEGKEWERNWKLLPFMGKFFHLSTLKKGCQGMSWSEEIEERRERGMGEKWETFSFHGEILSFTYTKTGCQEMSWPEEIE